MGARKRSLREKEIRESTDFRYPNSLADSGRAIRVQKICAICGERSVVRASARVRWDRLRGADLVFEAGELRDGLRTTLFVLTSVRASFLRGN